MFRKLKSFLANDLLFNTAVLLLIGIGSFGLGRQSVLEQNTPSAKPDIQVIDNAFAGQENVQNKEKIAVVGSKSGTKYHLPDCPGALQIKEANLIRFASIELAEAAGYSPAANCLFD